jgi:hypothetical protein
MRGAGAFYDRENCYQNCCCVNTERDEEFAVMLLASGVRGHRRVGMRETASVPTPGPNRAAE